MSEINIYCDESNHLEADSKPMVLGAISCPREKVSEVNKRIREIKMEHGLPADYEMKWVKVSKRRISFYVDIVNYFFDKEMIGLRVLVANKSGLNHNLHNQTHSEWYYKMYYLLLTKIIQSDYIYRICVDKKDTLGKDRVLLLKKYLCNTEFDFNQNIIKEIREVNSHSVQMVQLVDLLIGAVQFNECSNTPEEESKAKREIVDLVKSKSGRNLTVSTLPSEFKFNLFFWKSQT
jgi:hypothetical protein